MHGEIKKIFDLLYCSDMELNLKYLQGMPVTVKPTS